MSSLVLLVIVWGSIHPMKKIIQRSVEW